MASTLPSPPLSNTIPSLPKPPSLSILPRNGITGGHSLPIPSSSSISSTTPLLNHPETHPISTSINKWSWYSFWGIVAVIFALGVATLILFLLKVWFFSSSSSSSSSVAIAVVINNTSSSSSSIPGSQQSSSIVTGSISPSPPPISSSSSSLPNSFPSSSFTSSYIITNPSPSSSASVLGGSPSSSSSSVQQSPSSSSSSPLPINPPPPSSSSSSIPLPSSSIVLFNTPFSVSSQRTDISSFSAPIVLDTGGSTISNGGLTYNTLDSSNGLYYSYNQFIDKPFNISFTFQTSVDLTSATAIVARATSSTASGNSNNVWSIDIYTTACGPNSMIFYFVGGSIAACSGNILVTGTPVSILITWNPINNNLVWYSNNIISTTTVFDSLTINEVVTSGLIIHDLCFGCYNTYGGTISNFLITQKNSSSSIPLPSPSSSSSSLPLPLASSSIVSHSSSSSSLPLPIVSPSSSSSIYNPYLYNYANEFYCPATGVIQSSNSYPAGSRGYYYAIQASGSYLTINSPNAAACQTVACNLNSTGFNFVQYSSLIGTGCPSYSCCYLWPNTSTNVVTSNLLLSPGATYVDGIVSSAVAGIPTPPTPVTSVLTMNPPPQVCSVIEMNAAINSNYDNDIYTSTASICAMIACASGGYYDSFTWVVWSDGFYPCKGYSASGDVPCCYLTSNPSTLSNGVVPNTGNSQLVGMSGYVQPYTYTNSSTPYTSLGFSNNVWPMTTAGPGLVSYTSGYYFDQNYGSSDINEAGYYYPITGSNADVVVAGITIGACQQILATSGGTYGAFGFIIYTSSSNGDCAGTTCCHLISGSLSQSSTVVTPGGSIVKTYYGYLNSSTGGGTTPVCNLFIPMPYGKASGSSGSIQNAAAGGNYVTLVTLTADACFQMFCALDPTVYVAAQWILFVPGYATCNGGLYCCYILTSFWMGGGSGPAVDIPNPSSMTAGVTVLRFN